MTNKQVFVGTGTSAPHENMGFEERNAVVAIVFDPKTDNKYLVLDWGDRNKTFVTGGIKEGETTLGAALRKVREKTGYSNLNLISRLPEYEVRFYDLQKEVNQHTKFECFLLELESDKQSPVSQAESDLHKVIWLTANEIKEQVTGEGPLFLINHIGTTRL